MALIQLPAPTSMTLIGAQSVSGATTVLFQNIPAKYKLLLVTWNNVFQSASTTMFGIRLNNDSGSNYKWSGRGGQYGSTFGDSNSTSDTIFAGAFDYVSPIPLTNTSLSAANVSSGNFTIYDANSSTSKSVSWSTTGYRATGLQGTSGIANGQYYTTSPINRIEFIRNSTQTVTGNFYLYGIE